MRAVILSEFPCLLSYDFTSNQKNDAASDTHMARWISLFAQMDKTLSEEEKHLVGSILLFFFSFCCLIFLLIHNDVIVMLL